VSTPVPKNPDQSDASTLLDMTVDKEPPKTQQARKRADNPFLKKRKLNSANQKPKIKVKRRLFSSPKVKGKKPRVKPENGSFEAGDAVEKIKA